MTTSATWSRWDGGPRQAVGRAWGWELGFGPRNACLPSGAFCNPAGCSLSEYAVDSCNRGVRFWVTNHLGPFHPLGSVHPC